MSLREDQQKNYICTRGKMVTEREEPQEKKGVMNKRGRTIISYFTSQAYMLFLNLKSDKEFLNRKQSKHFPPLVSLFDIVNFESQIEKTIVR